MFTKLLRLENLKKVKKAIFIVMPALALLAALLLTSDAEASGRPLWERLNRTRWDFNRFPVRQCPICGAGSWTTAAGQIQTYLTALSGASTAATAARLTTRGAADLAELKQGIDDLKTQLQQAQTAKDALDGSNFDSIPNIAQERANAADTVNKIKGYLLRGLLNRIEAERATATGNALTNLNNYKDNLLTPLNLNPSSLPAILLYAPHVNSLVVNLDDLYSQGKIQQGLDGEYRLSSISMLNMMPLGFKGTIISSKKIVVVGNVSLGTNNNNVEIKAPELHVVGPYQIWSGLSSGVKLDVETLSAPDSDVIIGDPTWGGAEITGNFLAKSLSVRGNSSFKAKKIYTAGDISASAFNAEEVNISGAHIYNVGGRFIGGGYNIGLLNMPDSELNIGANTWFGVTDTAIVKKVNVGSSSRFSGPKIYTGQNVPRLAVNEPAEYIPRELRDMNGSTLLNLANNFPQ